MTLRRNAVWIDPGQQLRDRRMPCSKAPAHFGELVGAALPFGHPGAGVAIDPSIPQLAAAEALAAPPGFGQLDRTFEPFGDEAPARMAGIARRPRFRKERAARGAMDAVGTDDDCRFGPAFLVLDSHSFAFVAQVTYFDAGF